MWDNNRTKIIVQENWQENVKKWNKTHQFLADWFDLLYINTNISEQLKLLKCLLDACHFSWVSCAI